MSVSMNRLSSETLAELLTGGDQCAKLCTIVRAQLCKPHTSNRIEMDVEQDKLLSQVAKLYYLDELRQGEIGDLIGISRTKVSRMLTQARHMGIVRISVDGFTPRNEDLEQSLAVHFGLKYAIVTASIENAPVANVRRSIGYYAAPYVSSLIHRNSIIGVAGGRTLRELFHYMTAAGDDSAATVVQLMGNIGPSVSRIDAIEISRVLAQLIGGQFYTLNAPTFAADIRTRDAFFAHEHVRKVWDLYGRMQTAFVGIGSLDDSAFIERNVLEPSDIEHLRMKGAVGEICGRFYDIEGQECVPDYRDRVISIKLEELRQVPDVIGVTNGSGRVEAVYAALISGLVKSIIIDEAGASAVLARAHS